jgi:hypothetical protein
LPGQHLERFVVVTGEYELDRKFLSLSQHRDRGLVDRSAREHDRLAL